MIRTLFSTLLFILLSSLAINGQGLPVYDNTNFLSLGKQLIESAKQTSELLNTVELLKEQKQNLEIVSSVVGQLKAVRNIERNNERLFTLAKNDLSDILNSPYIRTEEADRISESFNDLLENSLDDLDFIGKILSSDLFKMSDSDRTAILKEKEEKSKERVADLDLKSRRYRDIISFRKMQDRINNRQTEY